MATTMSIDFDNMVSIQENDLPFLLNFHLQERKNHIYLLNLCGQKNEWNHPVSRYIQRNFPEAYECFLDWNTCVLYDRSKYIVTGYKSPGQCQIVRIKSSLSVVNMIVSTNEGNYEDFSFWTPLCLKNMISLFESLSSIIVLVSRSFWQGHYALFSCDWALGLFLSCFNKKSIGIINPKLAKESEEKSYVCIISQ